MYLIWREFLVLSGLYELKEILVGKKKKTISFFFYRKGVFYNFILLSGYGFKIWGKGYKLGN